MNEAHKVESIFNKRTRKIMAAFFKSFFPFIPLIIGTMLKIAIIDDVPASDPNRENFLISQYAKPLWLELMVVSYIMSISASLYGDLTGKKSAAPYTIVSICLCLCLFFVLGFPKLGIVEPWWQIWIPDLLSVVCVVVIGLIILL